MDNLVFLFCPWKKIIWKNNLNFSNILQNRNIFALKGQLISKCLLWCFQFSQKTQLEAPYVVKSNFFFVCFFGELKIPKRHFEINWPLVMKHICCRKRLGWWNAKKSNMDWTLNWIITFSLHAAILDC